MADWMDDVHDSITIFDTHFHPSFRSSNTDKNMQIILENFQKNCNMYYGVLDVEMIWLLIF